MFSRLLTSAATPPAVSPDLHRFPTCQNPTRFLHVVSHPTCDPPNMTVGLSSLDRPTKGNSTPQKPLLTRVLSIPTGGMRERPRCSLGRLEEVACAGGPGRPGANQND